MVTEEVPRGERLSCHLTFTVSDNTFIPTDGSSAHTETLRDCEDLRGLVQRQHVQIVQNRSLCIND